MRFCAKLPVGLALWASAGIAAAKLAAMPARPSDSAAVQAGATVGNSLRFEDYRTLEVFTGTPAPVQLRSAPYGRMFRTRLREAARAGPNFAGTYTIALWGCGSNCQVVAVIDVRSGALSQQTLRTTNGIEYRRDSRLIIADPIRPGDPPRDECAVCGTPAAYEWTGNRFKPVGQGPHPHVSSGLAFGASDPGRHPDGRAAIGIAGR